MLRDGKILTGPTAAAMQALQQGYRALAGGDAARAGKLCRQLIERHPQWIEPHFLVGLIAAELGDWLTVQHAMKTVLSKDASRPDAWAHLARSFAMAAQYQNAAKALERAVALKSDDPMTCDILGSVYSLLGDQEKALEWQLKAVAATGRPGPFHLAAARSHIFLGQKEEAEALLEPLCHTGKLAPRAHWLRAGLRKARDDGAIKSMAALLDDADAEGQVFLHYAMGKCFEDLERWDEAFDAFAAGAAGRRAQVAYDEAGEKALFAALEENLTHEWLHACPAGHDTTAPIFIIGQPRTGTTLLERIISAHSAVHSAGELQQFGHAIKRATGLASPQPMTAEIIHAASCVAPAQIGKIYMETTVLQRGNAPHFIDKLPVNYLYAPLIAASLPGAKIIHMRRGAMDSCFASFKQLFADAYFHSYDLEELGRHYLRYHHLMERWQAILGPRLLTVDYENLVSDTENQARMVIKYLGLDWEDKCLEFYESSAAVTTASASQVRQKPHRESIKRWRRYKKQLAFLENMIERAGLVP